MQAARRTYSCCASAWETMIKARAAYPTKALFLHDLFLSHFGAKGYAENYARRNEPDVKEVLLSFARAAARDFIEMWNTNQIPGPTLVKRLVFLAAMRSRATIGAPAGAMDQEGMIMNGDMYHLI